MLSEEKRWVRGPAGWAVERITFDWSDVQVLEDVTDRSLWKSVAVMRGGSELRGGRYLLDIKYSAARAKMRSAHAAREARR